MRSFLAAEADARGSKEADCFQKFKWKEDSESNHKPEALVAEIKRLYALVPKLSPAQMHDVMSKMIDPVDNGLMFCWSKRGTYMPKTGKHKAAYDAWTGCNLCSNKPCKCNGKLPTIEELTQYLAYLTKVKKTRGTESR